MKKKLFLSTSLLCVLFLAFSSNAQAVNINIAGGSGNPGDTIEIPITAGDLSGAGVVSCDAVVQYDPAKLSLTNVAAPAGTLTVGWEAEVKPSAAELALLTVPWHYPVYNPVGEQVNIALYGNTALSGAGTLAKLIFKINTTAGSGPTSLTLTKADLNEGKVASTLGAPATITITGGTLRGDVDNNGIVNSADYRLIINRFLTGAPFNPSDPVDVRADVNNDEAIDAVDVRVEANIILGG